MKKTMDKLIPLGFSILVIFFWEIIVRILEVPKWILPAPSGIIKSLVSNLSSMYSHTLTTFMEAFIGFTLAIVIAFVIAFVMDSIPLVKKSLYPILIISQTIPIISIAPLFIIWFGYGFLPKIIVVQLVCFFPIVISLLGGLSSVDEDQVKLLKSMGASNFELFKMVKLPASMPNFFAGLKIAATYSVMGAIIGEWLGAEKGLGVFMTLAQKSFQTEKVFVAILIVTLLSLVIFALVSIMEKIIIPWKE